MFAQSDRGTITGTVVDPAGAVVANAPIEARSLETGAVYPAASTTTGNYTLAQLPVGTYELSAAVPGFKKYVRRGLTVQVAETLRIDVTLEVGSASESVTITADAPLLKTESGDLSYNVATARLDELPILGIGSVNAGSSQIRNPYAVTSLISGSYYCSQQYRQDQWRPGQPAGLSRGRTGRHAGLCQLDDGRSAAQRGRDPRDGYSDQQLCG